MFRKFKNWSTSGCSKLILPASSQR